MTFEEALLFEAAMITERKPRYNILQGGIGFQGLPKTREHIEKVAAALRGQKRTPEQVARMTASRQSPEYREKIASALRGKKRSPEVIEKIRANKPIGLNEKSVICLEDGRLHPSLKKAASYYGIARNLISSVTSGRTRTAGGLHFIFSENEIPPTERVRLINEDIDSRCTSSGKYMVPRGIVLSAASEQFRTLKEAADFLGVSIGAVAKAIRTGGNVKGQTARWANAEQVIKTAVRKKIVLTDFEKEARALNFEKYRSLGPASVSRKVICHTDGREFSSTAEAAREYNVSRSALIELCNKNPRRKTVGGHVFSYG
jgi:hypothetical protein